MDMLQNVLGGQSGQDISDFIKRYQTGKPWEGVSDQEALDRYSQVATQLPPDQFRQAAEQAFAKLTPEQRAELARILQTNAQQQSVSTPALDQTNLPATAQQDPGALAGAATQIHEQQPNLLQQLLGEGGALSNPIAKAALAGIAAMAAQRILGSRNQ
jgi:predicted RNA-binding Zn ribbon-like protein